MKKKFGKLKQIVKMHSKYLANFIWLENVVISFYVSTFQSLMALSSDPLARIVPILLKATEFTFTAFYL